MTVPREEMLRRFEQWLDGVLAAEAPPCGIDAELLAAITRGDADSGAPERLPETLFADDAHAVWAAMTALTHEVKLQGRAFKELHDALGTQTSQIAEEIRAAYRQREQDVQREVERRCQRDALGVLIDLRDRLARGLDSARGAQVRGGGARRPWAAWAFGPKPPGPHAEALAALLKGYELGLEHLDHALAELNVREIRCVGLDFDPRTMNAIDKEESEHVTDGTVLEVYRTGYEWGAHVFRPAQVKVAVCPARNRGPQD